MMSQQLQSRADPGAAQPAATQNAGNWLSITALELLSARSNDGCEMSIKELRCAVHRISRSAVTKRVMAVLAMLERAGLIYMTEPERDGHKRDSGRVGLTQQARQTVAGEGVAAVLEAWYERQGNGWAAGVDRGVRGGAPRRQRRRETEVRRG
jgi:hypothetical protein